MTSLSLHGSCYLRKIISAQQHGLLGDGCFGNSSDGDVGTETEYSSNTSKLIIKEECSYAFHTQGFPHLSDINHTITSVTFHEDQQSISTARVVSSVSPL